MTLQFLGKDEKAVIGHALRVENTVEMVAFMLHDPRMKPGHLALDRVAVEVEPAIAHPQMARHDPAQSRDGQATLPAISPLIADWLDNGIDQRGQLLPAVVRKIGNPVAVDPEHNDPVGDMDLWCRDPGAAGILHRLDHVLDE